MRDSEFTYYAFVSHSHHDSEWATWIWSELERYRVPYNVRKVSAKPLPARIQPVFIDKADLGPGQLIEELYKELDASKYLVVVCSPESAKPSARGTHYVNAEVSHFIETGRTDRVIPVIVSGTSTTAFCPALREQNIFAINATKLSRRRVINDIVARILGLRPDDLWRREERRRRAVRIRHAVIGFVAAIMISVAGLFMWENARTVEINYADYVTAYGLPQGLFELSDEAALHKESHYRFVYRGLRYWPNCVHEDTSGNNPFRMFGFKRVLRRVDSVNSAGVPVEYNDRQLGDRPVVQVFDEYASNGTLRKMHYAEFVGDGLPLKLTKRLVFSDARGVVNAVCGFEGDNHLELAFARSTPLGDVIDNASGKIGEITQHVVSRDAYGRVQKVMFYSANQNQVCDAEGVAGYRFCRDKIGRVLKQTYLDLAGKDCSLTNGVSSRVFVYDGAVCTVNQYEDIRGRLVRASNGWARVVSSYDEWLNYVSCVFYDENGGRTMTDEDFAECRHVYDGRGYLVRHTFHGVDGNRTTHKRGYAEWRSEFDEKGHEIRNSWIGVNGHPCLVEGYAEFRSAYDEHGLMVAQRYYDADGKPCCRLGKDAGWNAEYDEKGQEIRTVWIGVDGKPCLVNGYAEYRCSYDDNGHMTSVRYYGADGAPCLRNGRDAGWNAEYDYHGRLVRRVWVGMAGEPCLNKGGFAECRCEYDNCGNRTRVVYFDQKGHPCAGNAAGLDSDWESSDRR